MNEPTEPHKPWPPSRPYWYDLETMQIRKKVGPVDDEEVDEPYYPDVNIEFIEKWAEEHGVDPRAVKIELHPGGFEWEMVFEVYTPVTEAMRAEADRAYQAALLIYQNETLPEYEAALAKYKTDRRAYYLALANEI